MFLIETKKEVDKFLATNSILQKRFDKWIEKCAISPYTENDGQMKSEKREGLPVYKKRLGDYRALYVIKDSQMLVLIFKLGHRSDVYEL